jgi:putative addiction module killer protein
MLLINAVIQLTEYVENSQSFYAEWFSSLDAAPAARIDRYVRRMEFGNFGDLESVGEGVRDLRINFGPGYRVYYGIDEGRIVLLLGSGTKRGQSREIRKAIDRWATYKKRK